MKKHILSSLIVLGLSTLPGLAYVGSSLLVVSLSVMPWQALAGGNCEKSMQAATETAESVIAQHLQALGGEEKLKAAQTFQLTATTYEGEQTSKMTVRRSRPHQMRYDIQKGGTQIVKAFDGKSGWYVEGSAEAKAVEPEKQAKMAEKAAFDDALVEYSKKGVKVELAGVAEVEGAQAYKLVLTRGGRGGALPGQADVPGGEARQHLHARGQDGEEGGAVLGLPQRGRHPGELPRGVGVRGSEGEDGGGEREVRRAHRRRGVPDAGIPELSSGLLSRGVGKGAPLSGLSDAAPPIPVDCQQEAL
jgi:hypothetical protein